MDPLRTGVSVRQLLSSSLLIDFDYRLPIEPGDAVVLYQRVLQKPPWVRLLYLVDRRRTKMIAEPLDVISDTDMNFLFGDVMNLIFFIPNLMFSNYHNTSDVPNSLATR